MTDRLAVIGCCHSDAQHKSVFELAGWTDPSRGGCCDGRSGYWSHRHCDRGTDIWQNRHDYLVVFGVSSHRALPTLWYIWRTIVIPTHDNSAFVFSIKSLDQCKQRRYNATVDLFSVAGTFSRISQADSAAHIPASLCHTFSARSFHRQITLSPITRRLIVVILNLTLVDLLLVLNRRRQVSALERHGGGPLRLERRRRGFGDQESQQVMP